jgi:hypothetical protein
MNIEAKYRFFMFIKRMRRLLCYYFRIRKVTAA